MGGGSPHIVQYWPGRVVLWWCCGGAVVVTVPGDCGGGVVATWALGLGCQVLPTQSLLLRGEHWLDIPSNKAPGAAVLTIFSGYPLPPCPS